MRPNVVLIVLDTLRADALEPYGAAPGSSPALADLARAGSAAPNLHATASWTVPSHGSMFTGMLPRQLGMGTLPGAGDTEYGLRYRSAMEDASERNLAAVLSRNGYSTSGHSTNLWLRRETGFATGFERWEEGHGGRQAALRRGRPGENLRFGVEAVRAQVDDGAREAEDRLAEWIDSADRSKPFFWFVNLVECHSPYLPPRPDQVLGPVGRWRAAREAREHLSMDRIWEVCAGGEPVPEPALERMRALYSGAVRSVDAWCGRLAERLDRAGLLEETLLIITSDHGENFGEDGLIGHAFSLDERLTRVPMIITGGPAERGPEISSLQQLPGLIAGVAELDESPWERPDASALAVSQFDPPAPLNDPRVEQALTEWGVPVSAAPRIASRLTAAVDASGRKLLRREGTDTIFDLEADPFEADPLDPNRADPEVAALIAAIDRCEGLGEADGAAESNASPPTEIDPSERADLEARMRALGYL